MGKIADATRTWSLGQEQRRQMLAFDAEFVEMETKIRRLDAQVLDLEKKVNPLEREVDGLKKRVEEETAKAKNAEKLAAFKANKGSVQEHIVEVLREDETNVLKLLAHCRLKDLSSPSTEDIANVLKVNEIRATVLLRSMEERKYIWFNNRIAGGWFLNERGEEYLVKHNII